MIIFWINLIDSEEVCHANSSIVLCPQCDKCTYVKLSDQCTAYRINSVFDNPGTIFFSVFMSIWGTWNYFFMLKKQYIKE